MQNIYLVSGFRALASESKALPLLSRIPAFCADNPGIVRGIAATPDGNLLLRTSAEYSAEQLAKDLAALGGEGVNIAHISSGKDEDAAGINALVNALWSVPPGAPSPSLHDPFAALESPNALAPFAHLVGLDSIVHDFRETCRAHLFARQINRKLDTHLPAGPFGLLISGPPGVGKITLARAMANAYKKWGVIEPQAEVHTIQTQDLAGTYAYEIDKAMKEALQAAKSGILIVKNLDALAEPLSSGKQALKSLGLHMSDHPDAPIVIATAAESSLPQVFSSAPFAGRFSKQIAVPAYDNKTLAVIFERNLNAAGFSLADDGARESVAFLIDALRKHRKKNFGNARELSAIMSALLSVHAQHLQASGMIDALKEQAPISEEAKRAMTEIARAHIPGFDPTSGLFVRTPTRDEIATGHEGGESSNVVRIVREPK